MNLRRKLLAFLKSQKKDAEYTELEWIGNEENCYIFFPLVTAGKDIVELEYEAQFTRTDVQQAEGKNGDPYFFMGLQANSVWYAGCGYFGNSTVTADTEWHHFRLVSYGDDNGFWLDGTRIFQSTPRDGAYLPQGFRLWIGQGGSRTTYNRKKYVKVKVNGELVYDLIPVLDKDLEPCLYDKLTGKYFYNEGTGEFKWKLPNQLEYLESDGNQYILTDYYPNSNTAIEVDYLPNPSSAFTVIYGSLENSNANKFHTVISSTNYCLQVNSHNGSGYYGLNGNGKFVYGDQEFIREQIRVVLTVDNYNKVVKTLANGQTVNYDMTSVSGLGEVNCVYPLIIFNRMNGGVVATANGYKGKMYSYKIWESDKLLHYYIPAFDENLNVCMYDLVSKTYLYNQGSGVFKGYFEDGSQLVAYLESTGTQYINMGVFGTENISIRTGFEFTDTTTQYLFGSCVSYNRDAYGFSLNPSLGKLYRVFIGANTGTPGNISDAILTKTLVNNAYFSINQVRLDDEVYDITSVIPFTTPTPMYLFARSTNGKADLFAKVKVKFFKIYDNGVLVQYLIPVVKSDNTACMYDLVSKKYFPNAGSGTFNYGEIE